MADLDQIATTVHGIIQAFRGLAVSCTHESELSGVVRLLFEKAGLPFKAEAPLRRPVAQYTAAVKVAGTGVRLVKRRAPVIHPVDRVDFLIDRVGIELKVDGSWAAVLRQLDRYAASPDLDALVLVTTRRSIAREMPPLLRGKPLVSISLGSL